MKEKYKNRGSNINIKGRLKYKDYIDFMPFFNYKEGGESFKGKNIIFSPPILKVLPQTFRNVTPQLIL